MNGISSILSSSIPVLGTLLSPTYFQYFLDKVSSVFTIFVIAKTSHIVHLLLSHIVCQHGQLTSLFWSSLQHLLGLGFISTYTSANIYQKLVHSRYMLNARLILFYLLLIRTYLIALHFAPKMLLDTQAVKTILLDIPALGKQVTLIWTVVYVRYYLNCMHVLYCLAI